MVKLKCMKVNITTLGCPKNVVDSGHLSNAFISEGFDVTTDPHDADIILINTCGFIKDAKEESIEEILRLSTIKDGSKRLLVFGCLAKRYKDELSKEIPEIDGIWGVGEEREIIDYCKQLAGMDGQRVITTKSLTHHPSPLKASYAYLKIAEGCDKRCAFCVIPSIRGAFRSYPPDEILREAEGFIRNGIKEIILVAQDITRYGKGLDGYNLVSLLNDLASINGEFYIRLLYLYPSGITDDLIDCIAGNEKVFKYLDIPLQHSEDRLLRLMGRRGSRKEYIRLIRRIRRNIPGIALRTTFIVGFPTETEDEFKALIDFVEDIGFDRLGVFKYSKEEGTPASRLKPQIPEDIKERRYDELMRIQALVSLTKNKGLIGKRFRAIVDGIDNDVIIARFYSHAPDIDGVVMIPYKRMSNGIGIGDLIDVEIVDAEEYDLRGVLV
ncbi:MAG: 30S ribosomal protein S12 methylthiotransferase RimO [Thermodesulfovibrionia bacterium]